ncbi:MAG: class I SAM-dependent methyltransferase [Pseudomonadota bacterium]|nr:class I SAM-dependent methyltransferase [Afipia sp.]
MEALRPEISAGGFDRYDGTMQFYHRVNALLMPDFTVVDFGAGRGVNHIEDQIKYRRELLKIKGKVRETIGVDVDNAVKTNPALDRSIVITGSEIPLPDNSVDLILSDFTFEHLGDPAAIARSFDRILKPGGWLCARTPNRFGYIALINRLLPDNAKSRILHGAQPDRKEEDVFPALYRMNTFSDLRKVFPESRYRHASYYWDASPSYYFGRRWVFSMFSILHGLTPDVLKTMLMIFIQKRE